MARPKTVSAIPPLTKYFLLVLLITLPIIGFYAGIYHQKRADIVTQTTPSASLPIDWKTYTDSQNAYSFKYPSDWILKSATMPDGMQDLTFTYTSHGTEYTFAVAAGGKHGPDGAKVKDEIVSYDGKAFTKRTFTKEGKIFGIALMPEYRPVYFNNIGIHIPPEEQDKYIQIFNQILSTFKFTK